MVNKKIDEIKNSTNKMNNTLVNNESFVLTSEQLLEDNKFDYNPNNGLIQNKVGFLEDFKLCSIEASEDIEGPNNDNDVYNSSEIRKTFRERCCSQMNRGSFRSALISVCMFSLGCGVLSIPFKFTKISLFAGWFILLMASPMAFLTMKIIVKLAHTFKINNYSSLVKRIMGRNASKFLDFLLILQNVGVFSLYLIIMNKLTGSIVYDIMGEKDSLDEFLEKSYWANITTKAIINYTYALLLLIIIFCFKEIHNIRFPSFIGLISVAMCILIILGQIYFYIKNYWENIYKADEPDTWINLYNVEKGFDSNLYFFRTFSTLFLGYNYHIGLILLCSSLEKNNLKTKNKIIRRSIFSYTTIFFVVGTAGFFTCPINAPEFIILRYKYFKYDWLINIGRLLIIISYMMKTPINFKAYRISIYNFFTDNPEQESQNAIIDIISILIASTLSTFYSRIQNYLDIIGGICSVNVAFVFPCILYLMTSRHPKYHHKNIGVLLIMIFTGFIGYTSAVITIYNSFFQ